MNIFEMARPDRKLKVTSDNCSHFRCQASNIHLASHTVGPHKLARLHKLSLKRYSARGQSIFPYQIKIYKPNSAKQQGTK